MGPKAAPGGPVLEPPDAPNGFMRNLRHIASAICLALFSCGLIAEYALDVLAKPVPFQIYLLLLATGLGLTEPVFSLFGRIGITKR